MAQPVVGREEFVGTNVTKQMKEALEVEAERQGISRSKLLYDWLLGRLGKLGHHITDAPQGSVPWTRGRNR